MFNIDINKAPGPDGFGSSFYKESWGIVGEEVCDAVLDFLEHKKLLREINATSLTLVPKTKSPGSVTEFGPIACCNVIYKCISKVLCERLKKVLPAVIAENQSAFVHSRFIIHNIMVCQDLVRQCGRGDATASCLIKLDLKKAYDTVEWSFIKEMMVALQFPKKFIDLIMVSLGGRCLSCIWEFQNVQKGSHLLSVNISLKRCALESEFGAVDTFLLQPGLHRDFLWYGNVCNKPGYIVWNKICCKKKFGGLGLRNIEAWNAAALGKHVWAIAQKQDNLWVKWINAVYLKGKNWLDYQPKADCSWYWKQICLVKDKMKSVMPPASIGQ
uniref:Reverse transcriptase domain-containing protein n=1 Tax=Chenopodium quinoa TaxID=63459 RepID=A0A803MS24_CHEQI